MYDLVLFLWGKEDTEARQGVVAYGMARLFYRLHAEETVCKFLHR